MESIYYVLTWLCHRTCRHCYEDRFRPYYGTDLDKVVSQSKSNFGPIIANFPLEMKYLDPADSFAEKTGRVILAGGEVLLDPVRETVLYPAMEVIHQKYQGHVRLVVQTTGDLLNERLVEELLERHVWMISVSGLDEYHDGIDPDRIEEKLKTLFEKAGLSPDQAASHVYHFFGATPSSWIGKLWPRGRAAVNDLSSADITDNFCNRWSGGLNFLDYRHAGSEVSIDPEGNVFPCCIKTRKPVGNLLQEPLERILDRLRGNPIYEAISMGHPERMGITHGWTVEEFYERSKITLPSGRAYQNLCVGCDRFHEEFLKPPELVKLV